MYYFIEAIAISQFMLVNSKLVQDSLNFSMMMLPSLPCLDCDEYCVQGDLSF